MHTTIELLQSALRNYRSERALSIALKLDPSTLAHARRRGRLSPIVAAKLAHAQGEPFEPWMAQAALEAEPEVNDVEPIRRLAAKVRAP